MKKLFSVMLVLALCGFASAAIDIYITDAAGASEITVFPSDYLELLVWYTGVSETYGLPIQMFDLEADVTSGPGTILGGAITAVGRMTAYDGINMPGFLGGDIELMGGRDDNGALGSGLANPLARISLHCDAPGRVVIGLADVMTLDTAWNQIFPGVDGLTYHGMIVNQIPEPATIALLCLGGLLIRKKR